MTQPIVNAQPKEQPKFTFRAGAQAGYKQYGVDALPIVGANAGAKVEYKGFHAEAEITAGTALGAKVEVGKEFDINKNWGLDLSANASHTASTLGKNKIDITHKSTEAKFSRGATWTPAIETAGLKAMANYTSDNGKLNIGFGASGQYVSNNASNCTLSTKKETAPGVTQITTTSIKKHKEGLVISPELQVGYKINDKLSLGLNANALGGTAGISYTF